MIDRSLKGNAVEHHASPSAKSLVDRLPGRRGTHYNRASDEVAKAIFDHSLEHPTGGGLRVAEEFALKGVGRDRLHAVIDCHSRDAWGRLYTSKLLATAVHVINSDELPFFDKHGVSIINILSDNGR